MDRDWAKDLRGQGNWIWHDEPMTQRQDMALFFDRLTPPASTKLIRLHVSADNRYQLYADFGKGASLLGRGPARSDLFHTSLDPYALDYDPVSNRPLRLWAAVRWNAGRPQTPNSEMHGPFPAFLLIATFHDAAGKLIGRTATGNHWKVYRTSAITDNFSHAFPNWVWLGAFENHQADAWPADWLSADGAGESWKPARGVEGIYFKGDPPWQSTHWLVPRTIPAMLHAPGRFVVAPSLPVTVAPGQTVSFLFDAGVTTNAYPAVRISGAGSSFKLSYAEVMRKRNGDKVEKHFSLAADGAVEGPFDTCALGADFGDRVHVFEPFHWRAFRFVRLDLTAGPRGATLHDVSMTLTGYPLDRKLTVEADGEAGETLKRMIDVSWRTLDRCCWETLMDCPFYEQLQYIGDGRLEALQLYVAAGDQSLAREALRAFDRSRLSEGLSQSCYPSSVPVMIPPFSLLQILMADDYLQYTRDESLIAELRPGLAQILEWFEKYIDAETGLLGKTPYWPFVDWVDGWRTGMPPSPCNAPINLHYLLALQSANRLSLPRPAGSPTYAARAAELRRRIRAAFWDESIGMICDEPAGARSTIPALSQHAQALATLSGVLSAPQARRALRQAINGIAPDWAIKPTSYYFRFYLAEAVAKVGWGAAVWGLFEPFRAALTRGSTTWPEMYEPSRSECHAFSAWPVYFFARHILGVCPPDAHGEIAVRPLHVPPIDRVSGTVMTCRGPLRVSVEWHGSKRPPSVNKNWA